MVVKKRTTLAELHGRITNEELRKEHTRSGTTPSNDRGNDVNGVTIDGKYYDWKTYNGLKMKIKNKHPHRQTLISK